MTITTGPATSTTTTPGALQALGGQPTQGGGALGFLAALASAIEEDAKGANSNGGDNAALKGDLAKLSSKDLEELVTQLTGKATGDKTKDIDAILAALAAGVTNPQALAQLIASLSPKGAAPSGGSAAADVAEPTSGASSSMPHPSRRAVHDTATPAGAASSSNANTSTTTASPTADLAGVLGAASTTPVVDTAPATAVAVAVQATTTVAAATQATTAVAAVVAASAASVVADATAVVKTSSGTAVATQTAANTPVVAVSAATTVPTTAVPAAVAAVAAKTADADANASLDTTASAKPETHVDANALPVQSSVANAIPTAQPQIVATPTVTTGSTTSTTVITQVIPEITKVVTVPGTHRMQVSLHPANLGEVKVTVVVRADGAVRVDLVSDHARDAIANGVPDLQRILDGLGKNNVTITVRHSDGSNAQSFNSNDQRQPQTAQQFQGALNDSSFNSRGRRSNEAQSEAAASAPASTAVETRHASNGTDAAFRPTLSSGVDQLL